MSIAQLRAVKNFFAKHDKEIDGVVDLTFRKVMAARPDVVPMFPGNLQQHQQVFSKILRKLIELTRTCYLWPVSVQTGHASLPGLDHIRARHEQVGVTASHFGVMKIALIEALQETFPQDFSQDMHEAFAFVFDVLAKSMVSAPARAEDSDLLKKFAAGPTSEYDAEATLDHVMGYADEERDTTPRWQEAAVAAMR